MSKKILLFSAVALLFLPEAVFSQDSKRNENHLAEGFAQGYNPNEYELVPEIIGEGVYQNRDGSRPVSLRDAKINYALNKLEGTPVAGKVSSGDGKNIETLPDNVKGYKNESNYPSQNNIASYKDMYPASRGRVIKKALDDMVFEVSFSYMIPYGEQKFSIISETSGRKISELTYPIKGGIFIVNGEVNLGPKISVGGRYGSSNFRSTTCSDEDWGFWAMHNGAPEYIDYQITEQKCESNMEFFDINLYYRLYKWNKEDINKDVRDFFEIDEVSLDVFAGYQEQSGTYRMKDPFTEYKRYVNGAWWQLDGLPLYAGLDSFYKIKYKGPRAGLRLEGALNKRLFSRLSFAYSWLETNARGWWNLRDYSFWQEGDGGYAINFNIEAFYRLNPNWFLGMAFVYTDYRQDEMKESGTQPGFDYTDADIVRDVNCRIYGPAFQVGFMW
ncbi:MAG: hypothetical protein GF375_03360 [Candidatus Omnitrophica bacterium]|nr:hypothetical protein [Candidatus Omnitrophota bacterium]MBD3269113.1 hypothetical protein [Candidatus Omnitrophota bacterium]